jgi:DNA polymerase III delta prime subunit
MTIPRRCQVFRARPLNRPQIAGVSRVIEVPQNGSAVTSQSGRAAELACGTNDGPDGPQ